MNILPVILILFNADFSICSATDNQYTPVALFENDQYYAFWQDARFFTTQSKWALCAARIAKNGTVIDPDGKVIYSDSAAGIIDAAYDGSNFLVVFRDPNC